MLQFELITPERKVVTESVYELILPAVDGQISILPGHISLVTLLRPGVVSIRHQKGQADDQLDHLAVSGGFVEVSNDQVKLMADSAERAEELEEAKIVEAKAAAQREAREAKDEVQYTDAVGRLELELAREKVRNLKRRHHTSPRPATKVN